MVDLVPGFLILALYTGGALAGDVCYYVYSYYVGFHRSYYYGSLYCPGSCCGYYTDRSFCTSTGSIAGAIIGCIFFVAGIVFLVFLLKRCNRTQTGVVIASQNPRNTGVSVVTTNTQAPPQQQHPGLYPPPGSYPGGSYPPPQPAAVSNTGGTYFPPPPPYDQGNPAYPPPPKY
ncbi:uncharacterized protein LOC110453276 [Mizuhopecten yessoensis]|uniref:Cysteine and tyrosine-rich protein 1 n=1 Tax=Mizuhopecten yessoensis TaxID=6573 RepID=A0A210QI58_MIZYE|nr:uncharacterized protein LOC110453276 [Mizuhopecten yessoensis]OWF48281.1 hypothetical protein KP79_PYT17155 [Mizuhopecten yessoensis]